MRCKEAIVIKLKLIFKFTWFYYTVCHVLIVLKDALEFVGWELIGVISQAVVDEFETDAFQECNKILKIIAEVRK